MDKAFFLTSPLKEPAATTAGLRGWQLTHMRQLDTRDIACGLRAKELSGHDSGRGMSSATCGRGKNRLSRLGPGKVDRTRLGVEGAGDNMTHELFCHAKLASGDAAVGAADLVG